MRHVTLTCKNHPQLRWSCKSIAYKPGYGYNGARNIFFLGRYTPEDAAWPYQDVETDPQSGKLRIVRECPCSPRDLILAPEDPDYGKERLSDGA